MKDSLLSNLKKAGFEIGQVLSKDETLQRLLVCDNNNALETKDFEMKTFNELVNKHYITFDPTEHAITSNDVNSFLVITDSFLSLGDSISSAWRIHIVVDSNELILKDNKNRILEILDRVVVDLDDYKLSAAGQISISGAETVFYSEFLHGKSVSIEIVEQRKETIRKRAEI